jgi:hypothetical protein
MSTALSARYRGWMTAHPETAQSAAARASGYPELLQALGRSDRRFFRYGPVPASGLHTIQVMVALRTG